MLGEIHIALLRNIIKDIEDVARTPAPAGGANQNVASPGGGHPQIVEGVRYEILSYFFRSIVVVIACFLIIYDKIFQFGSCNRLMLGDLIYEIGRSS